MSYVRVQVDFTPLADDDEFVLDQLTEELADELREIGEVERVPQPGSDPGSKGVAELALGVATVLAGVDPGYVQALVKVVVAFLQRNTGRRARLRVGDTELTIDRPTGGETAELIRTAKAAQLEAVLNGSGEFDTVRAELDLPAAHLRQIVEEF